MLSEGGESGESGTATVWRARDKTPHREVGLQQVRAPAGLPAGGTERLYARPKREAWAAARLSHRGADTGHEVAREDGRRPWSVGRGVWAVERGPWSAMESPPAPRSPPSTPEESEGQGWSRAARAQEAAAVNTGR